MTALIARFWKDEQGSTAIEYALIAAIISIGLVVSLKAISDNVDGQFSSVADGLGR